MVSAHGAPAVGEYGQGTAAHVALCLTSCDNCHVQSPLKSFICMMIASVHNIVWFFKCHTGDSLCLALPVDSNDNYELYSGLVIRASLLQ